MDEQQLEKVINKDQNAEAPTFLEEDFNEVKSLLIRVLDSKDRPVPVNFNDYMEEAYKLKKRLEAAKWEELSSEGFDAIMGKCVASLVKIKKIREKLS